MNIFWMYLWLLVIHYIGDFVFQSHWMASNKSKRFDALGSHVLVYTLTLVVLSALPFYLAGIAAWNWWDFIVLNAGAHLATDYCTSRWSARLWARQEWHNFFVVIGLDQLIHFLTLGATLSLLWHPVEPVNMSDPGLISEGKRMSVVCMSPSDGTVPECGGTYVGMPYPYCFSDGADGRRVCALPSKR